MLLTKPKTVLQFGNPIPIHCDDAQYFVILFVVLSKTSQITKNCGPSKCTPNLTRMLVIHASPSIFFKDHALIFLISTSREL